MMRYWNDGWLCGPGSTFHGPFGMLMNLTFWFGMILLAIWLFKTVQGRSFSARNKSSALRRLDHRYAAGEIDQEEFERIKGDIS